VRASACKHTHTYTLSPTSLRDSATTQTRTLPSATVQTAIWWRVISALHNQFRLQSFWSASCSLQCRNTFTNHYHWHSVYAHTKYILFVCISVKTPCAHFRALSPNLNFNIFCYEAEFSGIYTNLHIINILHQMFLICFYIFVFNDHMHL